MSAADDAREQMEATVHQQLARAAKHGITAGAQVGRRLPFQVILTAVDRYVEAAADERIAGHVHEKTIGRERLAEAVAEVAGKGGVR